MFAVFVRVRHAQISCSSLDFFFYFEQVFPRSESYRHSSHELAGRHCCPLSFLVGFIIGEKTKILRERWMIHEFGRCDFLLCSFLAIIIPAPLCFLFMFSSLYFSCRHILPPIRFFSYSSFFLIVLSNDSSFFYSQVFPSSHYSSQIPPRHSSFFLVKQSSKLCIGF